jgi:hypothetical protein
VCLMSRVIVEGVSRQLTTSWRSANASPLSTELIRTALSPLFGEMGLSRVSRTKALASAFFDGVTLSSRSYAMTSAFKEADFAMNRGDEPGTWTWH